MGLHLQTRNSVARAISLRGHPVRSVPTGDHSQNCDGDH
jgi:hypothetical protein